MTYHQELLARVNTTQLGLALVPPARVFIEREAPIEKDECPALVIALGESRVLQSIGADGPWDLLHVSAQFTLSVHTRGEPQTLMADPVIAEAHTALMADPSLGGAALRLRFTGSQPRAARADGTAGIFDLTYEATVVVSERTLGLHTP